MSRPEPPSTAELRKSVATLGLDSLVEAAGSMPLFLVGGVVRDLLLGRERTDIDIAVEGDAIALARRLGDDVREHERFGTATVRIGELTVDLARTRTETYSRPGALPEIRPASIDADLARRDFTINAIAVPLARPSEILDPHGGRSDLAAGRLRVLHDGSFRDDPTRALRAARYAARFSFGLETDTERLLREADLATVSAQRVEAALLRLTAEPRWRRGFELLSEWGLSRGGDFDAMAAVRETCSREPWGDLVAAGPAMLAAGGPSVGDYSPPPDALHRARELAGLEVGSPAALAAAARGSSPQALAIARALGARWLDTYVTAWRHVRLEIDGGDLLGGGIERGPAIGRGLAAALEAKLDRGVEGRDEELQIALEAARDEGE